MALTKIKIFWVFYNIYHEKLNNYYYQVCNLIKKNKINFLNLLQSKKIENRRIAIKLISDGMIDLSSSDELLTEIVNLSIVGNDNEKIMARELLIIRNWLDGKDELIKNIINNLLDSADYYIYQDIGYFLYKINNIKMFSDFLCHLKKVSNDEIEEIEDLYHDLKSLI